MHKKEIKVLLLLLVFFTFLHSAYAATEESLIDRYVYEIESVVLDNDQIPVSIVLTPQKAKIDFGDDTILMDYGSTVTRGSYEFQIGSYITEACENDGFSDYDDGKYCRVREGNLQGNQAIAKLSITKRLPKIEVDYDIDSSSFFVGSRQEITVTITNEGQVDFTNVEFRDQYPWDLYLSNPTMGQVIDNTIILKASVLKPGASIKTTVKVDIREPVDTIQAGTLTYTDDTSTYSIVEQTVAIKTKSPVSATISHAAFLGKDVTTPEFNESYEFRITLDNNIGKMITITDFTFEFPEEMEIDSFDVDEINGVYKITDQITSTLYFDGDVLYLDGPVEIPYSYYYADNYYRDSITVTIANPPDAVDPSTKVEVESIFTHEGIFIPHNRERYSLRITNTGETRLTNVRGYVESDFFEKEQFFLDSVAIDKTALLTDVGFKVPYVSEELEFSLKYNITYDAGGKTFEKSGSQKAEILPIESALQGKYTAIKTGDFEYTLTSSIKSSLPYLVTVDGQMLHTLGPKIIADKKQQSFLFKNIESNDERELFAYTVLIPDGVSDVVDVSLWINDVRLTDEFTISGAASGTTSNPNFDVSVSYPASLNVGDTRNLVVTLTNKGDVSAKNIMFTFEPSSAILVSEFGSEKFTDLIESEKYTKEITFTTLAPGNKSLGSLYMTYYMDGVPYLYEAENLDVEIMSSGVEQTVADLKYVEAVTDIEVTPEGESLLTVVITNPRGDLVEGSFEAGNMTIDFSVDSYETKDYYFSLTRFEADDYKRNGMGLSIKQTDGSTTKQVIFARAVTPDPVDDAETNTELADNGSENTVTLISEEEGVSLSKNVLLLSVAFLIVIVMGFIILANVLKKKKRNLYEK